MPDFRQPDERMEIEVELSERARALLERHGQGYSGDIRLPDLSIMSSQGDLMIERISDYRMVYMESPNKTVVRTSLEGELSWALDLIKRHTVLEDLADV